MDDRDPLRPLDVVSWALLALCVAWLLAGTMGALVAPASFRGLGQGEVCGVVTPAAAGWSADPAAGAGPGDGTAAVRGLASDGSYDVATLAVCDDRPATSQRVALATRQLVTLLAVTGFLVLLRVLLRRARQEGLFSLAVSRVVRLAGWYLVGAAVVVDAVRAYGTVLIVGPVVPGASAGQVFADALDVSPAVLLGGIGVLVIARVLRIAVSMREDLDATI
jgi:hypothetical protein